jgi:hypothetical protein
VVIAAQDGGPQPRVTTATATVVVLDFPDEKPKFSQQKYEADVPENIIDFFVAQVQVNEITIYFFFSWLMPIITIGYRHG